MKIISDHKVSGSARRLTKLEDGTFIETWYDRKSRNWITYRLDAERCQMGDAEYCGTSSGAKLSHFEMIRSAQPQAEGVKS